ncbi:MAG: hypothetical protein P1U56_06490 [Saprospiraceae bacterium]|nr:hypothetical protein [Saprospiraceae bacterium]
MNSIQTELQKIAAFYKINDTASLDKINNIDLDHYVEIVLTSTGFEIVTGGASREKDLIEAARSSGYPEQIVEAFDLLTKAFPNKMLYSKQCFGPDNTPPSMYLCVVEPWEKVMQELNNLPGLDNSSELLSNIAVQRKICFLLGFTSSKNGELLITKTYHLAPFNSESGVLSPYLISNRCADNKLSNESKTYAAGVNWEHFEGDETWNKISALGNELFGDKYGMMLGQTKEDGKTTSKKAYIFRYDKRENEHYSLKTYNYYAEEGAHLMRLGDYRAAIDVFTESIEFHRDNDRSLAELYNMRGTLHYSLRNINEAKKDILKALELNNELASAHNNLSAIHLQFHEYEEAVYSASSAMYLDPATDVTNLTVAKRLLREAEMKGTLQ